MNQAPEEWAAAREHNVITAGQGPPRRQSQMSEITKNGGLRAFAAHRLDNTETDQTGESTGGISMAAALSGASAAISKDEQQRAQKATSPTIVRNVERRR